MQLSRALKQKRSDYAKRHDKMIFQHDKDRLHVAKPIKETLKALNWNVLSHSPYSSDIASSNYHLQSITHNLSEQRFHSYEDIKKMGQFVDGLKRYIVFSTWNPPITKKMEKVMARDDNILNDQFVTIFHNKYFYQKIP